MRVALVGDEYYPDIGGAALYALELSLQLVRSGIETVVITHMHPGQLEEEEGRNRRGENQTDKGMGTESSPPHFLTTPFLSMLQIHSG